MAGSGPHSAYVRDAARLLGEQVRLARLERRWSQRELAQRAGITGPTLRKVENGDPSVALGTALDVAALVGVPLFHEDRSRMSLDLDRTAARAALLPQRVRTRDRPVRDDF
ncbi:MAG: helix-turn-helix transcriptional regulator [Solirubrobacteraceae bacterium]